MYLPVTEEVMYVIAIKYASLYPKHLFPPVHPKNYLPSGHSSDIIISTWKLYPALYQK